MLAHSINSLSGMHDQRCLLITAMLQHPLTHSVQSSHTLVCWSVTLDRASILRVLVVLQNSCACCGATSLFDALSMPQVGSIFEYVDKNPVFGVIQPDNPLWAPVLGLFAFTGIPLAG